MAVNLTDDYQTFKGFAPADSDAQVITDFSDADIIAKVLPPPNELPDDNDDDDTVSSSPYILTAAEALKYIASLHDFVYTKALSVSRLNHLDDLENAMIPITVYKQAPLMIYFQWMAYMTDVSYLHRWLSGLNFSSTPFMINFGYKERVAHAHRARSFVITDLW